MLPNPDILVFRARVVAAMRSFFDSRGYVEVETPVRIPAPALELHIDAEPSGERYLRTSPELDMKCLLGQGMQRVYQIGPCFRHGERGRLHQPEFTMVEWYALGLDYRGLLAETRELVESIVARLESWCPGCTTVSGIDWHKPWDLLTVAEVYRRHAGWDPCCRYDADRFDLDMVSRIEPALPRDRGVVLMDYPVEAAALARCRAGDPPVAERWELYLGGIEIANAYGELTDAVEQRRRFAETAEARRAAGRPVYPTDERFLAMLDAGLPACSGIALGLDRLVMVLAGTDSVQSVRAFCP